MTSSPGRGPGDRSPPGAAPRGAGGQRPLRRARRAEPGERRDPPRLDPGHHRSQRCWQDDPAQRDQRLLPPLRGTNRLRRQGPDEPQLLLLDEPMAGMNVEEKEDMCRFILDVNAEFGTTIALIEHDMGVVMDISDRVVVLDYGRKIADGPPAEVRKDSAVLDAYLGVSHD